MSYSMNTYSRIPVAFTHGEGRLGVGPVGEEVPRCARGHRGEHARPRARRADAGDRRSERPPHPRVQPLPDRGAGAAGGEAREDQRHRRRFLLQFRVRSERGRDQARPPLRSRQRCGQPRDRRHGQGLPRQDARDALGHRQQEGAGGIRTPGARVRAGSAERHRRRAPHRARRTGTWSRCSSSPSRARAASTFPPMQYLRDLRELCDRHGWFLMVDEVQCGLGRTGKWFVYQHAGILPDVVLLAKGLASGVPIGACLARGTAAGVFKPGTHGSTFGGNPLACAAALATLEAIEEENLMRNAEARRRHHPLRPARRARGRGRRPRDPRPRPHDRGRARPAVRRPRQARPRCGSAHQRDHGQRRPPAAARWS